MSLPKLQVALDHADADKAIEIAKIVGDIVDILEVGTVLLFEEGSKPISRIRELFPDKMILADPKCADAGDIVAKNIAKHGADAMTCISAADVNTILSAKKHIENIQVELFGEWTMDRAKEWLENSIDHVIYHQSRDNNITWGEKDLSKVQELINMGFKVSVTGGLKVTNLKLFKGIDIDTFIVGRDITGAENPAEAAALFQKEISKL